MLIGWGYRDVNQGDAIMATTKRAAAGSTGRARAGGGSGATAAKSSGKRSGTVRKSVGGKTAKGRAGSRAKGGAAGSESMMAGLGTKAMEAAKSLVEKGAELIEQIKPGKKSGPKRRSGGGRKSK